jgi:hypothetical protein
MLFPSDDLNGGGPPKFQGGSDFRKDFSKKEGGFDEENFDGGTYYVDFGPLFGQELAKILRFRQTGLMTEIVFWQGGYGY